MLSLPKKAPKIALIQLHVPAECSPASQFKRAEKFIRQAAAEDADVAILPEMSLGCALPGALLENAQACAAELPNFQALAKELNINIIPGSYLSLDPSSTPANPRFHNTTHYIARTGSILHTYHKINLWGSERSTCIPGTTHLAFSTPEFGLVGLLICWDLAFPEAFRSLIKQGARWVFIPTMWKSQDCGERGLRHGRDSERIFIDSVITARAFEEICAVVFCNVGSDSGDGNEVRSVAEIEAEGCFGGSQVSLPFKGQIARCDGREQCLVVSVGDVDEVLRDAEEVWGIRGDVMGDDWYLKNV